MRWTGAAVLHTVSDMAVPAKALAIGVHTPTQNAAFAELRDVWSAADRLGYDLITVWDHLQSLDGTGTSFDAVAAHATLASTTRSARVGCLVYSVGYRHPASLALAAITIDHASGGRAVLGLGAGYLQDEYRRFGFDFDPPAERIRRLEACFTAVRDLLDGHTVTRSGPGVELDDARLRPLPVQPRLPMWIGGGGEQRTLPLAGRVADGWNIPMATSDDFARKNEIVSRAAEAAERDPAVIERSVSLGLCFDESLIPERYGPRWEQLAPSILTGSDDRILDMLESYRRAGATQVMLSLRAPLLVEDLERFAADILPVRP